MYATVTLTGKISFGLEPAVGRAILTPTVNQVSDLDGNVVIYGSLIGVLDATGAFSIEAPATDDANLRPQNFGYTLRFELERGTVPPIPEFGLATAVSTVDLTDIIPEPQNPTFVPTLTGPPNVLTVNSVTTGAPGSVATVVITGESPNQTIDFVIPRGDVGATGPQGPPNTLTVGAVTTGAAGSPADVDITGVSPNQTIDFVIPQGIQGIQGVKGDPGDVSLAQLNDGLALKVAKAGDTMTGTLNLKGYNETVVDKGAIAAAGTLTLNPDDGSVQYATMNGAITVAFDAGVASGDSILLRLYMATAYAVTWPAGIRWQGGAAPSLATGYNLVTLWREGTVWYGTSLGVFS